MRAHLGLDPFANAAVDGPMVLTPTGYVPLEAKGSLRGLHDALVLDSAALPKVV